MLSPAGTNLPKANSKDTRTLWSGFFEVSCAFCDIQVGVVQKLLLLAVPNEAPSKSWNMKNRICQHFFLFD